MIDFIYFVKNIISEKKSMKRKDKDGNEYPVNIENADIMWCESDEICLQVIQTVSDHSTRTQLSNFVNGENLPLATEPQHSYLTL